MKFTELNLPTPILRALSEQGYETPTPIQAGAIPPALEGRDVLGCARTGTGKTCAFATPILTRLNQNPRKGHPIRALVLTPTRELALQNQECFAAYGAYLPLRSTVIFGGVGQNPQVEALQKGTDILVATPGRLADLYQQGYIDLTQLEIFVLDEADRMLDMGFIHDVKKILQWLPEKKQTLFFSATMPNEVQKLVNQLLHDPVRIAVDPVNSTVDTIDQSLYRTDKSKKIKLLTWLLREHDYPSVLVFTRTKHGANRVARDLEKAGITAAAIHGNKSQTARQTALADFKSGKLRVLVATDIAARGLDIEGLACVVNYNLPDVPETYVHRIGRTGRAGQAGIALSFCDVSELEELAAIEKQLKKPIPTVETHPYPMEELEVPMKDSRGRKINPEDAEARAAAREQSQKRREKLRTMAEQAKEQPAPAPSKADGKQERKNRPAKNRKERPAKPSAAATEPVLKPEEDVGSYADWVKYRSSTRQPERKPYSATALDELLALPDFADELGYDRIGKQPSKGRKAISGGKVMDATARMFLKGSAPEEAEIAEEPSPRERRSSRRSSPRKERPAPAKQQPAPAPAKAAAKDGQPKAKSGSKRRRTVRGPKAQPAAPAPQAEQKPKQQPQKAKPQKQSRPAHRRSAPAQKSEGSEGKSLIHPYYLSDSKGKR